MNDLNDIYREWKSKGGQKGLHTTNGVPSPYMDNEDSPDFSKVRACSDCGSLNVSFDVSTNETVCTNCNGKDKEPHRVNFEKEMENTVEEELKNIEDAIKRGQQFGKVD